VAVDAALDHVRLEHNSGDGLDIESSGQTVFVAVSDSSSTNNNIGIFTSSPSGSIDAIIRNTTMALNTIAGLEADGSSDSVWFTRSTIMGNGAALGNNGGTLVSYEDNNLIGNGTPGATPTTVGYQ
jgi:hypothetical protein